MPELGRELVGELGEEAILGDPPPLELEQRVLALALRDARHRPAERLHRDSGVVLQRGERADERRGEHPAEIRDHRLDHAVLGVSTASSPDPTTPSARSSKLAPPGPAGPLRSPATRSGSESGRS